jgi:exonuclease VII small subunit
MPCTKCEEGKYKWGKTGECKYDSLDACESANSKYKMQPTPLGQKTYEEYAKELKEYNLSSVHRVELGLIDDALKYRKGVKLFGKNIDIDEEELEKTYRSVKVDISELEEDLNALKKGMKAIETSAKELGLKANSIPEYKDAIDVVSYGEKQIQKGKKLLK